VVSAQEKERWEEKILEESTKDFILNFLLKMERGKEGKEEI
jgi:hypothetical protein